MELRLAFRLSRIVMFLYHRISTRFGSHAAGIRRKVSQQDWRRADAVRDRFSLDEACTPNCAALVDTQMGADLKLPCPTNGGMTLSYPAFYRGDTSAFGPALDVGQSTRQFFRKLLAIFGQSNT